MTPDEFTNQELHLDVGDGHTLYVHDWGNKENSTPIVLLHGGPGNGVDNRDKQKFDPEKQRVIFHDQRGSGQSTPTGSREHNTTQDLVEDIKKIAQELDLPPFLLTGGSWGSFLALAYGIAHPGRVKAMVLNGVFSGTRDEIDWLDKGRFQEFFPEVWEEYLKATPESEQHNPTAYHIQKALGEDVAAAKKSAYIYETMELAILKLDDEYKPSEYTNYNPSVIQIELHYIKNHCFVPDNYILENAGKLDMPIYLVQGRYDMVCRPKAAYELSKVLTQGNLLWTINGHLGQHESRNLQHLLLRQLTGVE